jgi:hypothetical protein
VFHGLWTDEISSCKRSCPVKTFAPALYKEAVESQHGGAATFVESVPVTETHNGQTVWQGIVHVFDLAGHPKATRAYAWSSPIEGSDKRRFFAVLQTGRSNRRRMRCGRRSWRSTKQGRVRYMPKIYRTFEPGIDQAARVEAMRERTKLFKCWVRRRHPPEAAPKTQSFVISGTREALSDFKAGEYLNVGQHSN